MSKIILIFICFIANYNFVQSQKKLINQQKNSINFANEMYKTIYEIKLSNDPLIVELVEKSDGSFFGNVNIAISRYYKSKNEDFIGKMPIDSLITKLLISKIKIIALESVKNCYENDDCFQGFDGVDTEFKIKHNKIIKNYSFWELIPNNIKESNVPENRKKAQEILNLLDEEINLKSKYLELKQKLPKGKYFSWFGCGFNTFTIE